VTDAQFIPHAFTVDGAAEYSGISRSQLYVLMKTGELPWTAIRSKRMILRESIERLFAKNLTTN
jgi:excisionase family DNA binding protein